MFSYDMPLYRPPSEGDNIIVQATLGCSFNKCSFCSMYRTKKFQIKDLNIVKKEIDFLAKYYTNGHRVFLADGDAMSLPTEHLIEILKYLKVSFPKLQRVSCYASPLNLQEKTLEELILLKQNGLTILYYGIESGDDNILKKITKGINSQGIVDSINKVTDAGIKISATLILGLGGGKYSKDHIDNSAKLVNSVSLTYLSTLQLGLEDIIESEFFNKFKEEFIWLDDTGMLKEQFRLIEQINPQKTLIFRSNHASNSLSLAGNLPKDKNRLLYEIEEVFRGERSIKPKYLRGY